MYTLYFYNGYSQTLKSDKDNPWRYVCLSLFDIFQTILKFLVQCLTIRSESGHCMFIKNVKSLGTSSNNLYFKAEFISNDPEI